MRLCLSVLFCILVTSLQASEANVDDIGVNNGAWTYAEVTDFSTPEWKAALKKHRKRLRELYGPTTNRPLAMRKGFVETMAFLYDKRLYDHDKQTWKINEFLDRGEKEFGGYDQIILWQNYPRLGIDERSQFTYFRDLPGGHAGLAKIVEACHKRNVLVFISYNPWDTSTKQEETHLAGMIELLQNIKADGVYLDTMVKIPEGWDAAFKAQGLNVLFGCETHPYNQYLIPMHYGWGQGWRIDPATVIYNTRWLYPEFKTFLTSDRHSREHWNELCSAWMNGCGILMWENVFGDNEMWVERDKAFLRRIKPLQVALYEHWESPLWEPHIKSLNKQVKINKWPANNQVVYTLYNNGNDLSNVALIQAQANKQYIDLFTGKKLVINNQAVVGSIFKNSIGGILEINADAAIDSLTFVKAGTALQWEDADTKMLHTAQRLPGTTLTSVYGGKKTPPIPDDMVWIDGSKWKPHIHHKWHGARCWQHRQFKNKPPEIDTLGFAIDKFPVTNAQFKVFLDKSGYKPKETHNFLRHWQDGSIPKGLEQHPVVHVSQQDAKAYAKWAKKRLPTEFEWQLAAQGQERYAYPWGNTLDKAKVNMTGKTMAVGAQAVGATPTGVHDLCGHVWQWLDDVYETPVLKFTVVKGGSFYYMPEGHSKWYPLDGAIENTSHVKVPLLSPSLDRFSTVGFRCVRD